MSLEVDTSRPLRRPSQLRKLIENVVDLSGDIESDWLEWKESLDLASKSGQFAIGRTILGFANRNPDRATQMGGLAYLIVGAAPGALQGIELLDSADLDQGLSRYLGETGPAWNPTYVSCGSVHVLVLVVEPPQFGDPIYTLRRSYHPEDGSKGADDGTVFVRKNGRTVPARSVDMDMLERRTRAAVGLDRIAIEVSPAPNLAPLQLSVISERSLEASTREPRFGRKNPRRTVKLLFTTCSTERVPRRDLAA